MTSVVLLREYIEMVLEKIRSKRDVKSKFGTKFDLKVFKTFDNIHIMLQYAQTFLDKLGEGSSRAAFLLNSRYVLKIATGDKGLAQNQAEVDTYTNSKSKAVVAKIMAADSSYNWLISDLVKPLNDPKEFEQLTGTDWDEFQQSLFAALKHNEMPSDPSEFELAAIVTAKQNKLVRADLTSIEHWGKTPDGRCVLLDYGYTQDVYQKHYKDQSGVRAKSSPSNEKTRKPGEASTTKPNAVGAVTDKKRATPTVSDTQEDKTKR